MTKYKNMWIGMIVFIVVTVIAMVVMNNVAYNNGVGDDEYWFYTFIPLTVQAIVYMVCYGLWYKDLYSERLGLVNMYDDVLKKKQIANREMWKYFGIAIVVSILIAAAVIVLSFLEIIFIGIDAVYFIISALCMVVIGFIFSLIIMKTFGKPDIV